MKVSFNSNHELNAELADSGFLKSNVIMQNKAPRRTNSVSSLDKLEEYSHIFILRLDLVPCRSELGMTILLKITSSCLALCCCNAAASPLACLLASERQFITDDFPVPWSPSTIHFAWMKRSSSILQKLAYPSCT